MLSLILAAALVETPTMGWSSWNAYRVNISDKLIVAQAENIATNGLQAAGYRYVNIDDGWFGGRDANGRLVSHPTRFPNGMKPVIDRIHALGFKAGGYSDAGENTCGSIWDDDKFGIGVGFYKHDDQDAAFFFKELGIDFIKLDFGGGEPRGNSEKIMMDTRERYTAIRRAIDRTGRTDARVNVCRWNYPGTWVKEIGSSWRMSEDIQPGWWSVTNIVYQNLCLSAYAGPGHYNDMDMLEINVNPRPNRPKQKRLTPDECRAHFGMWCLMASPLLIGCDTTTLDREMLDLLTNPELIALDQDPCGQQAYVVKEHGGAYVLVRDLEARFGKVRAVGFWNPLDEPRDLEVGADELDLVAPLAVRDLYARKDLGSFARLAVTVPPHAAVLYRVTAADRRDRTVYEAETAFIPSYQEIDPPEEKRSGRYVPTPWASGGFYADCLGGSKESRLVWNEVRVSRAGRYAAEIATRGPGAYELLVNGAKADAKGFALEAGMNRLELANDAAPMPAVDVLRLVRLD